MRKYYSLMRPVSIGTYPKEGAVNIVNFDTRMYIPALAKMAWGYIEYNRDLSDKEAADYELEAVSRAEEKMHELFEALVPSEGKADTVAGEIVRAFTRLDYRFYNDGDMLGVGYGRETCNAAGRYLQAIGDEDIWDWVHTLWCCVKVDYAKGLEALKKAVVEYIEDNPALMSTPNEVDMWDYFDANEDIDDSEEDDWDE